MFEKAKNYFWKFRRINVLNINDAPEISGTPIIQFNEDDSLKINITEWDNYINDSETVDSLLQIQINQGDFVKVEIIQNQFIFSTPLNWFGIDSVNLIISDGQLADSKLIPVTVLSINDVPNFIGQNIYDDTPSADPTGLPIITVIEWALVICPAEEDTCAIQNPGDVNGSGNVDSTDLGLLLNTFGFTSASAATVPEPGAASLLFLAAMGLLGFARRRD